METYTTFTAMARGVNETGLFAKPVMSPTSIIMKTWATATAAAMNVIVFLYCALGLLKPETPSTASATSAQHADGAM